jgi:hypothetical protein
MPSPTPTQLIGGGFQDSEGNVLANGYLKMKLSQDGTVAGVGSICSGIEITIALDADGNAVTSPPQYAWANSNISPVNTFYRVTGYTAQGQPAWGPNNQQVGSGTFNIGTWIPNTVIAWQPSVQQLTAAVQYTIDGGGSVITTGAKGQLSIPVACTITGWILTADQSGSAVVDVLLSTFTGFPGSLASIAGTDQPTLTSEQAAEDLTLDGWGNVAVPAGSIIQFYVDSVATVTRLNLTLNVVIG